MTLPVLGEGEIEAHPGRLEELFENAATFAVHSDAATLAVELTEDGLVLTDDGTRPQDDKPDLLFDHGAAVPTAEAGMAMPNVETLAKAHGWAVSVDREYDGGIRVRIAGETVSAPEPAD